MNRTLIPSGGNDKVYTPVSLAKRIIDYYSPTGVKLEPCRGTGSFWEQMGVDTLWCELDDGIDFLTFEGSVDWIITNPPFSKHRAFLNKAMEVAKHIVFLCPINTFFLKARLRDVKEKGFSITEIIYIDTPKEFPQSGFQMGVIYLAQGLKDQIKITDWRGQ